DADVTFISSDHVTFKIHSVYLNLSTSIGFAQAPQDDASQSEPTLLAESAEVLEIIFQFIEPPPLSRNHKHPSIAELTPELFFQVAEAAEKYVIYGATNISLIRIE
ncbi:hypothetical protein BDN70DRAFT_947397, partial [Pholiota conissans]